MEVKNKYALFMLEWLKERSSWQAIGFFVGMFVSKDLGALDWGTAAAIGGALSGLVKLLPDKK